MLFSIFAYFYLPREVATARFLNAEEKELAFQRIQRDSSSVVGERTSFRDSLQVFRHPVAWAWIGVEMCVGVPLQSAALFLPQIVARLGYSTVKTNLYTVAPNIVGAVVLLILAFSSDFAKLGFPFIMAGFSFPLIGYIIYACVGVQTSTAAAYFSVFMMSAGTSAPSVIVSTWENNNVAKESSRIALTSVCVPMANLMGLVSSNIFLDKDAPKYVPALITNACFGAVGLCLTGCIALYMTIDKKRRNRKMGVNLTASDVSTQLLSSGPRAKEYRWIL